MPDGIKIYKTDDVSECGMVLGDFSLKTIPGQNEFGTPCLPPGYFVPTFTGTSNLDEPEKGMVLDEYWALPEHQA